MRLQHSVFQEYRKIFINTYFEKHLQAATSVVFEVFMREV